MRKQPLRIAPESADSAMPSSSPPESVSQIQTEPLAASQSWLQRAGHALDSLPLGVVVLLGMALLAQMQISSLSQIRDLSQTQLEVLRVASQIHPPVLQPVPFPQIPEMTGEVRSAIYEQTQFE